LILLDRFSGMIDGVFREVSQELAQRLGVVEDGAASQTIDLPQKLIFLVFLGHVTACYTHATGR